MTKPRLALFAATLALAVAARAQSSVTLAPSQDNTLYERADGGLSNGAGQHLFAGTTAQHSRRRALLAFDVAAALPAGAQVDSVRLTLHVSKTNAGPGDVALFRVTTPWGEGTSDAGGEEGRGGTAATGDATWVHAFFDTEAWRQPGGDFAATASATAAVAGTGATTWGSTPAMVDDVRAWLAQPDENHGWILVADESSAGTARRFDSRESATASARPALTVYYATGVAREAPADVPARVRVAQNYPNPFASETTITYTLDAPQHVTLAVYDALGRRVATLADGPLPAGVYRAVFAAGGLPAGAYLVRLDAGAAVRTVRMTLVR